MNRPIKFRCWANGKMEYALKIAPYEEKIGVNDFFGAIYFGQPIEWMQFTGLLDKNGKEIYEGDIVKAPIYNDSYKLEDCVDKIEWGYDHWEKGRVHHIPWKSLEVIGNIHENHDLLKS